MGIFFFGGERGICSRLRARSGSALTVHRTVIHYLTPFKSLHKIKRQNTHSDILSFWRRKRDLNPRDRFQPYSLSRGAPSPLGYFSKRVNIKKIGGEGGIRTHVPVKANGFQDRLVMTTSIPLHNY